MVTATSESPASGGFPVPCKTKNLLAGPYQRSSCTSSRRTTRGVRTAHSPGSLRIVRHGIGQPECRTDQTDHEYKYRRIHDHAVAS